MLLSPKQMCQGCRGGEWKVMGYEGGQLDPVWAVYWFVNGMKALFEKIMWKTVASTVDIYNTGVCSLCSRSIYRGRNWPGSTPAVKIEGRGSEPQAAMSDLRGRATQRKPGRTPTKCPYSVTLKCCIYYWTTNFFCNNETSETVGSEVHYDGKPLSIFVVCRGDGSVHQCVCGKGSSWNCVCVCLPHDSGIINLPQPLKMIRIGHVGSPQCRAH